MIGTVGHRAWGIKVNTPQCLPSRKKMGMWWANIGFGVRCFDSLWSAMFGA